jgi:hypothetical protein
MPRSPWRLGNRRLYAVSLVVYGVSLVPWRDGRDGMYSFIWRHLPGNALIKALISTVLVLAVVYVLFQYVFPWAEPLLPFNDVTVDNQ